MGREALDFLKTLVFWFAIVAIVYIIWFPRDSYVHHHYYDGKNNKYKSIKKSKYKSTNDSEYTNEDTYTDY